MEPSNSDLFHDSLNSASIDIFFVNWFFFFFAYTFFKNKYMLFSCNNRLEYYAIH
jgi:hypothetical protein